VVDRVPEGLYWAVGGSLGDAPHPPSGRLWCIAKAGCPAHTPPSAAMLSEGRPSAGGSSRNVERPGGWVRPRRPIDRKCGSSRVSKGLPRHMSSTFETVAAVIADTSEIPLAEITPDVHAIDDLGIDSLDFLDIVFALDKKFGIKIPLEAWTEEVNEGRASVDDYFLLKNLCARIDELVAAKTA
jgi:acyl carrier protein